MKTPDSTFTSTMEYLRRCCAMREYCRKDIKDKAFRRFSAAQETLADSGALSEKAVRVLVDEGFVSDSRYACAYVRDKSSIGGWGANKIRYMLLGKGLPRDVVEEALAQISEEKSTDKLRKALEIKYKSIAPKCEDPSFCREKLLRLALSRGHGYEESINIITDILNYYQNESK